MKAHVGTILTVMTGRMVAPGGIEAVQDLLEYLTSGPVATHSISKVGRACAPVLKDLYPDLAAVDVPKNMQTFAEVCAFLVTVIEIYGEWRQVWPPGRVGPDDSW